MIPIYSIRQRMICLLLIGLCLQLTQCSQYDIEELDFFRVQSSEPQASATFGCVELGGTVLDLEDTPLDRYGFVYTTSVESIAGPEQQLPFVEANDLSEIGQFSYTFLLPDADQTYYFRAFAQSGPRIIYGESVIFSPGLTLLVSDTDVENNQVAAELTLFGLESLNSGVDQSGITYAPVGTLPTVETSDTALAGPQRQDGSVQLILRNLDFNTSYVLRPFVQTPKATYYGRPDTLRITDGWLRVTDSPLSLKGGIALKAANFAAIGAGCPNFACVSFSEYNPLVWQFTLHPSGDSVIWTPFPDINGRVFAAERMSSFTIDQQLYLGLGEFLDQSTVPFVQRNFARIDLGEAAGQWEEISDPIFPGAPRSGAVAFVLNGKAYVGGGSSTNPQTNITTYFNDFYELDPTIGDWRPVAGLPLQEGPASSIFYNGRKDAIAYALADRAVVGGGEQGTLLLRDFWTFYPPNSAQDTGRWELHSFFPGLGRVGSVAFTVADRHFYGLGNGRNNVFYDDFWEFRPFEAQPWVRRTDFQGGARSLAIGFGFQTNGYVGTGFRTILNERQTAFEPFVYQDFWRYFPTQN